MASRPRLADARRANPRWGRCAWRHADEGSGVVIEVCDDGRGIDPDRIRRAAISKGMIDGGEWGASVRCRVARLDLRAWFFNC